MVLFVYHAMCFPAFGCASAASDMSPLSRRLAQQQRFGFCGHEPISSLSNVSSHLWLLYLGRGRGLQRWVTAPADASRAVHHLEGTSTLPTAVACFHAQHTHDWWSATEFCVRLGLFAVVPNAESAAKLFAYAPAIFCVRPSKILRTSQHPCFCVRPSKFKSTSDKKL